MIDAPPRWTLVPGVDRYTLFPPEGPSAGGIRYVERVRPLRRLGDIVAERIAALSAFTDVEVGAPERLVTVEGEYAALVTLKGRMSGAPARRCLGAVFVDDYFARVEGIALREDFFDTLETTTRDLVVADVHELGQRRRRYLYAPPPGWNAIARGLVTDFIPQRFPADWALISVYPAAPLQSTGAVMLAPILAKAVERGFEIEVATPMERIGSDSGLEGGLVEAIGRQQGQRSLRSLAVLVDARFAYNLEMVSRTEDQWPEHKAAFASIFKTIAPLPARQAHRRAGIFTNWAE